MSDTLAVTFHCQTCGALGTLHVAEDALYRRVKLNIENEHARQHPECPSRQEDGRIIVEVEL